MNIYYTLRGFFFVFFLLGNTFYLVAQEKFAFSDSHIKKEIRSIFAHDKGLDSFHLIVNDNNLSRLKVFRNTDSTIVSHNEIELARPLIYRGFNFYDLGFEGDLFFLKKDFSEMYEFVVNTKLQQKIKTSKKDKFFTIAITPQKSYLRRTGQGSVYAVLHPDFQGFVNELDLQYPHLKPVVKDSILILQAVVDQSGRIRNKTVLYGDTSGIYNYFFDVYDEYNDKFFPYNKRPYESLIRPFLSGGRPIRSLIDIYVRLNKDNTFTVSASGELRKLNINDFKDDPANPIIRF